MLTPSPHSTPYAACPHESHAEAAVLEPTAAASVQFLAHAVECPTCRAALEGARRTVAALRALPHVAGHDLTDAILARLPSARSGGFERLWRHPALRAAAAVLLVGIGVAVTLQTLRQSPDIAPPSSTSAPTVVADVVANAASARHEAAAWLAASQRTDGTWDVKALGGRPEHAPALTALAVMALHDQSDPTFAAAVEKGAESLVAAQTPSGCFGSEGTFMMYNHGLASVALLRLYADGAHASLRAPLDAAVTFIRRAQQAEGGWGYRPSTSGGTANASVSAWQLEALGRARQAGWGDPQGHLRRGLFWVSQLADARGVVGYQRAGDQPSARLTMTALGVYCLLQAGEGIQGVRDPVLKMSRRLVKLIEDPALSASANPYRDFFAARASESCTAPAAHLTARPDVEPLRRRLLATRVAQGSGRGSWDPQDVYAQVGGRLYTTSLAALALR